MSGGLATSHHPHATLKPPNSARLCRHSKDNGGADVGRTVNTHGGAPRDAASNIFQSGGGGDFGVATDGGEGPGAGIAALSESRNGRRFSETFGGGDAPIYAASADALAEPTTRAPLGGLSVVGGVGVRAINGSAAVDLRVAKMSEVIRYGQPASGAGAAVRCPLSVG